MNKKNNAIQGIIIIKIIILTKIIIINLGKIGKVNIIIIKIIIIIQKIIKLQKTEINIENKTKIKLKVNYKIIIYNHIENFTILIKK